MKIELFDLPNFEKELNINIIIRKDGEVVYSASSSAGNIEEKNSAAISSTVNKTVDGDIKIEQKNGGEMNSRDQQTPAPNNTAMSTVENKSAGRGFSGNLMSAEF